MKTIRDLTREQAAEIAKLMFPWPDEMTNIQTVFNPYIAEHYEDAAEYVVILFKGPGIADQILEHEITIYPTLDCYHHMKKENGVGKPYLEHLPTRSQRDVQMKFIEWGIVPSHVNQRVKLS